MKTCGYCFLLIFCVLSNHLVKSFLTDEEKSLLFGLRTNDASQNSIKPRMEKSLLNTFPFNIDQTKHSSRNTEAHHHDNHHPTQHVSQRPQSSSRPSPTRNSFLTFKSENNSGQVSIEDFIVENEDNNNDIVDTTEVAVELSEEESIETNEISETGYGPRKCIDKVMMVEHTEYDEVVTCDHSYDKRCHTSYVTSYVSQQQQECEENFRKVCYIEYEPLAYNETVEVCRTPVMKDCQNTAEELQDNVCRTVYETECWTKQNVHEVEDDVVSCETVEEEICEEEVVGYTSRDKCTSFPREQCSLVKKKVKKMTPETGCDKQPVELCAPRGCGFTNGPVICTDRIKTIVVDKPVEECALEPVKTCSQVTKLVPKLEPVNECVDVPKEICSRSQTNPRKVKKPVIKKWCYIPTKESGLI